MTRIYLSRPDVGEAERTALLRAFDSGWVAPLGPEVDAFEVELAQFCGRRHAVALSSGTAALHLALQLAGVKPGDRVLVSTLTFVATANAVVYCGAAPVFIDSEMETWNMDPHLLEQELESSAAKGQLPAAAVCVDLFGQCANYRRISQVCAEFGVPLVEDAAEALGATYEGRPAGSFGESAIVSFNGNKIMTTSGGGALLTDNPDQAARAKYLATQAREDVPHYEHREVGYNYRLSNLLAAVGRAQLTGLPAKIARRREIRQVYSDTLAGIRGVRLMPEGPRGVSNAWLTVITVDPEVAPFTSEQLRLHLEAAGIESRLVWKPMHLQPAFTGCEARGGEVAERLFATGLCLPSGSDLEPDQQSEILGRIQDMAEGKC